MRRILSAAILLSIATLTVADRTFGQRNNMNPVEGASLHAKLANAIDKGRAAKSPFWAGYQFEVRPGICVDAEFSNGRGGKTVLNAIVYEKRTRVDTRNLGVF